MAKLTIIFALLGAALVSCAAALPFQTGRIVGGALAAADQYPYQVSIRMFGSHMCGGSIIADRWILTAAHCGTVLPKMMSVVAGSIFLNKNGGSVHAVKRAINHDQYDGAKNDIALIELAEPLKFTKSVAAIKLSKSEVPTGEKIVITGWGSIYTKGPISNTLKYNNELTKLDAESCSTIVDKGYYNGLMCLKHSAGNGACSGDSGGPAIHNGVLVGVASFVIEVCGSTAPDGYVEVHHYIDWINTKTGLNL